MAPIWLGASTALGRPVSTDEPYPHICGRVIARSETTSNVRDVRLGRWQCAACAEALFRRWGSFLCEIAAELRVLSDLVTALYRDLRRLDGPAADRTADIVRATAVFISATAGDLHSRGRKAQST